MTLRSTLATQAPFHLEATVRVLQRRPSNRVDLWEGGRYLRVLAVGGASVLVEVENHGTIDRSRRSVRYPIRRFGGGDTCPRHGRRFAGCSGSMWTRGRSSGWR